MKNINRMVDWLIQATSSRLTALQKRIMARRTMLTITRSKTMHENMWTTYTFRATSSCLSISNSSLI